MKYLSKEGITYLWKKIKANFLYSTNTLGTKDGLLIVKDGTTNNRNVKTLPSGSTGSVLTCDASGKPFWTQTQTDNTTGSENESGDTKLYLIGASAQTNSSNGIVTKSNIEVYQQSGILHANGICGGDVVGGTHKSITFGDYNGQSSSVIEAGSTGSLAYGLASNGSISANGEGSLARGLSVSGEITSNNAGSYAGGCAHEGSITSSSDGSHAEGSASAGGTIACYGLGSHAEGCADAGSIEASSNGSHAEGCTISGGTIVSGGVGSHAEGVNTWASNTASHAEGIGSPDSASTAENAIGIASHSEGCETKAIGDYSHSEGWGTQANGLSAHAGGFWTITTNMAEHAIGSLNVSHSEDSSNFGETFSGNTLFSVGCGVTSDSADTRRNAFEIMQSGDIYINGLVGSNYYGSEDDGFTQDDSLQSIINSKGTVNAITPGVGLLNGTTKNPITSSGTLNVALVNQTQNTLSATKSTSTSGGLYAIELDKDGKLSVRVPWVNSNTTNTCGSSNSQNKLFLVGTQSQSDSATSYSNSGVYTSGSSVYATNGFFQTSDIRKKNIIKNLDIDKALEMIENCQTVLYTLKDDTDNKLQVGMIAQEIERYYPELVSRDEDGTLSLDYARLAVVQMTAFRGLCERIKNLENIISKQ